MVGAREGRMTEVSSSSATRGGRHGLSAVGIPRHISQPSLATLAAFIMTLSLILADSAANTKKGSFHDAARSARYNSSVVHNLLDRLSLLLRREPEVRLDGLEVGEQSWRRKKQREEQGQSRLADPREELGGRRTLSLLVRDRGVHDDGLSLLPVDGS